MRITFNVLLTQEAPWYVAKCVDNNVASQGKTPEEALDNLKEALELFYEDTEKPPHEFPQAFLTTVAVSLP